MGTAAGLFVCVAEFGWTRLDAQLTDAIYRNAVQKGKAVSDGGRIRYLLLTDADFSEGTRRSLDRTQLATVNRRLASLGPEAVAYDLIFASQRTGSVDSAFAASFRELGVGWLPVGLDVSRGTEPARWTGRGSLAKIAADSSLYPATAGEGRPYAARRAIEQVEVLRRESCGIGHISAMADKDGIFRHLPMVVRVDSAYVPALALSIFLDFAGVSFRDVEIRWGDCIRIPAAANHRLSEEIRIPIDASGNAFIPFTGVWGHDFAQMPVHRFLEHAADPAVEGNLESFFAGTFIFVGDVSTGIADLGQTVLEQNVPLVALHAAMLNALLQGQFFAYSGYRLLALILVCAAVLLSVAAMFRSAGVFYGAGVALLPVLAAIFWSEFHAGRLFPVVSATVGSAGLFLALLAGLHIRSTREQAFIRSAFTKFVPDRVVSELMKRPENLQLGGEERVLSVLFSDLVGFTTISEQLAAGELVPLLNAYFTEMSEAVIREGGIIDKYVGDAIMAEFGAPLPLPQHADHAVCAALRMQERLMAFRRQLRRRGLPPLQCRIGINTGRMTVGNVGSDFIFDYTVLGDAVNLASRLEGLNQQYGTSILVSEATLLALTPDMFRTRFVDTVCVKGKAVPTRVHEVRGFADVRARGRFSRNLRQY